MGFRPEIYKIENGILYKGKQEPLKRMNGGDCAHCGEPVWVSSGQALKHLGGKPTHKLCRKQKKQ